MQSLTLALTDERTLYEIATRVIDRADDLTREEVKLASESGLVIWDIDIDGPYPSCTEKYIELMDKFDPAPLDLPFTDEPSLAEQVLACYDDPTDETIPFGLQIDGHRLSPVTTYDNAGCWLDILAGHFPDANIGIVLA